MRALINKKFKLSTNNAFYTFLVLSLILSVTISLLFVGHRANTAIYDLQSKSLEIESKLTTSYLTLFLETRTQILNDLARQPILSNAIMGSDTSKALLQDYLFQYKIMGSTEKITIINVLKEVVFSNDPSLNELSIIEQPWINSLLEEQTEKAVILNKPTNTDLFTIAVPIKYNNFTEGVLMVQFNTPMTQLLPTDFDRERHGLTLAGPWVYYSNLNQGDEYVSINQNLIGNTDITLNYYITANLIAAKTTRFIIDIAISIIASMALSTLFLFLFGRHLLLNPFKLLESSKEAIKQSEARYELAVKGSNDGIWDWDIIKNEVYFSPRINVLLGYDENDKNALPHCTDGFYKLLHPDDITEHKKQIANHLISNTPFNFDYRLKTKSGAYRYFTVKGMALRNEHNKAIRMAGSVTDITEQKAANQSLIEAKAAAEQANIAKSEFLAAMSHEIRTPMNGVLGMLNLILDSSLNEKQHHQVSIALNSANSLLNIINDILDFSKVDAGKLELEELEFNLCNMLDDFIETIAIHAHSKNIPLMLDIEHLEYAFVIGDAGRLKQILTNLVNNALKFTHEGEVQVIAKLRPINNNQMRFSCQVIDSGIGISAAQQAKLFKSFSQVDSSTTRKYGGTGLGLAIVKKLCHLMEGDIQVQSKENKGSNFSFNVVLKRSKNPQKVFPPVDMSSLNILIVCSNQTQSSILHKQFTKWGATAVISPSAKQAVKTCQQYIEKQNLCFDLIMIDMQLSDGDALTLSKTLDKEVDLMAAHVVLMTTGELNKQRDLYQASRFSAIVTKPIITQNLFKMLSTCFSGKQQSNNSLITKGLSDTESLSSDDIVWDKNIRILLVEDNNINQIVASTTLKKIGINSIDIAENGQHALEYLKQTTSHNPYSLILMDCQMPVMDGYQATTHIRVNEVGSKNPQITIIAMTANAMVGDEAKCLQVGMSDYISKPIAQDILFKKLLKWLPYELKNNE
ncbi:PAS domain-containing hybrid sensor histidine kinase/response regulator [Pseudoalteromonas sp. meg-B1]|uniref:PAS domain-containing hybrid sensor histidine kinase/response regulator n=1 Tax=Pseudoalteromonas sp. meg-B1 TaxID=2203192 RepID=UPI000D6F1FD6|nr:PAS domain-containing hybrid sensor histidine kinase/response regulator [Pseudoalteromonas sp. meg-B1]PWS53908.1 hybrid sensor histidine kinase/response regulator [Pseudoalteromonas sp. meg-B1]